MKSAKSIILALVIVVMFALSIFLTPLSTSRISENKVAGTPPGWSDEINISNSPQIDFLPDIQCNGEKVYTIWRHVYNPSSPGADHQIVFSKSNDSGKSWSLFKNVSNDIAVNAEPEISNFQDNLHIVWSRRNEVDGIWRVFYRNSTDGGDNWNNKRQISSEMGQFAGSPHIFTNHSCVHIIWCDTRDGPGNEIYYRRSLDGGVSFDNGQGVDVDRRITFSPSTVSAGRMAGDGSNISIAWLDERHGSNYWEIYWMISKNNGNTWEDGLGHVGQDRRLTFTGAYSPAIAINGSNIHLVYMNPINSTYSNLVYINSTDNGASWNTPVLLAGPIYQFPQPDINVCDRNISVVWSDQREDGIHDQIYYKNSTNGGISWNVEQRLTYNLTRESTLPKLCITNETTHLIWFDIFPSGDQEVMYKRSPDFPPDTSPPSHSNEVPYPDSYKDAPGTNVSVHVTDPSGVNESTIQLYVNGSLVFHTSTPITDGYNVSYDSGGFSPGVITCRIVADDNLSNTLDYTWNFTVLALYGIQLHEGWNLISVPFVQVNTSIKEVLKDIDGKWDLIEYYDATSGEWKSYATFWPESLNEFNEINNTMAIWINITEPDVNLTSRGLISTYTEIPLKAGWNFVGYPTQTMETVGNALWGTGADRVEVFDLNDPYHLKEVGATYVMKAGEGYWVRVVSDTVWFVGW